MNVNNSQTIADNLRFIANRFHDVTIAEAVSEIIKQCRRSAERGKYEIIIDTDIQGPFTTEELVSEITAHGFKTAPTVEGRNKLIIYW